MRLRHCGFNAVGSAYFVHLFLHAVDTYENLSFQDNLVSWLCTCFAWLWVLPPYTFLHAQCLCWRTVIMSWSIMNFPFQFLWSGLRCGCTCPSCCSMLTFAKGSSIPCYCHSGSSLLGSISWWAVMMLSLSHNAAFHYALAFLPFSGSMRAQPTGSVLEAPVRCCIWLHLSVCIWNVWEVRSSLAFQGSPSAHLISQWMVQVTPLLWSRMHKCLCWYPMSWMFFFIIFNL